MNIDTLLSGIERKTFTRGDIQKCAERMEPGFQKTQMRYLIGLLLQNGAIVRVSHGAYQRTVDYEEKTEYVNHYAENVKKLIRRMEKQYPLLEYRVWELRWLNEFFNHQIVQNKIFLEIENDGCEFVYDYLFQSYQGKILLRPSSEEVYRYGVDGTIIIERLISEAPSGSPKKYNVPLEKIIVDMFSNKTLRKLLSPGDYADSLECIFQKYRINQSAMFRYARRRNKEKQLHDFLERNTKIDLLEDNNK